MIRTKELDHMNTRTALLLCLVVLLVCLSAAPNAQGQTTSITNLQYSGQTVLQNGIAQATVSFTVSFSGMLLGYRLGFGITYEGTSNFAKGSASSTPDSCDPNIKLTVYANSAFCVLPSQGQTLPTTGTEYASFVLNFNSTGTYQLRAVTAVSDLSNTVIPSSAAVQDFAISVTAQQPTSQITTVSQPVIQPPPQDYTIIAIAIIAAAAILGIAIIFAKRKSGSAKLGWQPVANTTGKRICTKCGERLRSDVRFCTRCGNAVS